MSLFGTLNTGASGMLASGTTISVIGDNIANVGTTGFKSTEARFADVFPNVVYGLGGANTIGNGTRLAGITTDFGQGSATSTGSALDIAVMGNGFFEVADGANRYYSRDGGFHLDPNGFVVNAQGLRLQGYQALDGSITSAIGDLQVDPSGIPQQATTAISLDATLSAETPVNTAFAALTLDGTAAGATLAEAGAAADFSTSVTVFDSLGVSHDVTMMFERTGPDTWSYHAVIDSGEVDAATASFIPAGGQALEIASGTLQFDGDGNLITHTGPTASAATWNWTGADPYTFDAELGLDSTGASTPGSIRMAGSTSYTTTITQNGYGAGVLASLSVSGDGTIIGNYDNGKQQALGQVALATFASTSGLERLGNNLFRTSLQSGDAALGVAGAGGRGDTQGFSLEASNVDLEEQFVSMIKAQRVYQANTGVIRSVDEALQQLVQLI